MLYSVTTSADAKDRSLILSFKFVWENVRQSSSDQFKSPFIETSWSGDSSMSI